MQKILDLPRIRIALAACAILMVGAFFTSVIVSAAVTSAARQPPQSVIPVKPMITATPLPAQVAAPSPMQMIDLGLTIPFYLNESANNCDQIGARYSFLLQVDYWEKTKDGVMVQYRNQSGDGGVVVLLKDDPLYNTKPIRKGMAVRINALYRGIVEPNSQTGPLLTFTDGVILKVIPQ